METARLRLPKSHILRNKTDIDALVERGAVLFKYPIKAYWLERSAEGEAVSAGDPSAVPGATSGCEPTTAAGQADGAGLADGAGQASVPGQASVAAFSRIMVSVPKRGFKRAVKRNLLKRRIREAWRLNNSLLGERRVDILFVYLGREIESYERIQASLTSILRTLADGHAE